MARLKPERRHPGAILGDELAERGMSQRKLARQAGVSAKHINQVVCGNKGIGPWLALMLEGVFGGPAEYWARLQADWDVAVMRGGMIDGMNTPDEQEMVSVPKALLGEVLEQAESSLRSLHSEFCFSMDVDADGRHVCDKDQEKIKALWAAAGLGS